MSKEEEIKLYYDEHISEKIIGYINGNLRLDIAFKTLKSYWPKETKTVLEIGSGAGYFSERIFKKWNHLYVEGIDISEKSVEIANVLFSKENKIMFKNGSLKKELFSRKFDLIVLCDVYEHIANSDKKYFNIQLAELLNDHGSLFLTFPTPRHLKYYRANRPQALQPIDENIDIHILSELAKTTQTELILYKDVDIWGQGDFAHAFLSKKANLWDCYPPKHRLFTKVKNRIDVLPFKLFVKPIRLLIVKYKLKNYNSIKKIAID